MKRIEPLSPADPSEVEAKGTSLRKVDRVEIISLVDNSVDFLSQVGRHDVRSVRNWVAASKGERWTERHFRPPKAEHGLSMIVRLHFDNEVHSILFDTGGSPSGAVDNSRGIGLDLTSIEAVVLSHGHPDHFGGLKRIVKAIGRGRLPVIVHEDMFRIRGVEERGGSIRRLERFPPESHVEPAEFVEVRRPYLLASGRALVTGEIPRQTAFEGKFTQHRFFKDGEWRPDPDIQDDRALVMDLEGKGLVVISGCAHAGIVNTVLYAQDIAEQKRIHAVLGGFHLVGKGQEGRILETVREFRRLKPTLVAPSHCTGWRGAFRFSEAMPNAFVWNSVGNLYDFKAER